MKRTTTLLACFLAILGAMTLAGEGHDHPVPAPAAEDARFEFLKQLAGSWRAEEAPAGQPAPQWEFRVTAGGSAVVEREFAGSPMEMMTFYFMEDGALRATHYCMLGNRPEAVALPAGDDERLEFGCAGTPGGATSHDDEHVHGWSMRLAADGKLHLDAEIVKGGEVGYSPSFVLVRAGN